MFRFLFPNRSREVSWSFENSFFCRDIVSILPFNSFCAKFAVSKHVGVRQISFMDYDTILAASFIYAYHDRDT